jgi:hypothetical protein
MDAVEELLERQGGMARRRQLRKAGMSRRRIRGAVKAGRLRLLTPDLYVTGAPAPGEVLRGALLRLGGVVSHESAALFWGIELVATPTHSHVTVERDRATAAHPGVEVHRADLASADGEIRAGIPMTSKVRTLFDLCRSLPLAHAVASVDSALRQGLVALEELVEALRALPPGRGRPRVARVLDLADAEAGSVLESLCRVLLAEAGLPRPRPQYNVRHRAAWIGRVDFAWPHQLLIVETDGFAFHSDRATYRRDRRRHNGLQLAGWVVLRFSWEDVVHDPSYVVGAVASALAEREAA